jgi:hypothetical protein
VGFINVEELKEQFIGAPVEIQITDQEGGEQAPIVKKMVKKIQPCPDRTHLRFYFDERNFLAVPFSSHVSESDGQWSAIDSNSGLTYTIKKVQVF